MKHLVLTSFFNTLVDPQRNTNWNSDIDRVMPLVNSVVNHNQSIRIHHDCFTNVTQTDNILWSKFAPIGEFSPAVQRWFYYLEYLTTLKEKPEFVFMVDSTDVLMLSDPFTNMKPGTVYTGDEAKKTIHDKWMKEKLKKLPKSFRDEYWSLMSTLPKNNPQMNAGVFGADVNLAIEFLERLCNYHKQYSRNEKTSFDMPVYNYTLVKHYRDKFQQGKPINTVFKGNEYDYSCWWKHK